MPDTTGPAASTKDALRADNLREAAGIVHTHMVPTPAICWPLLCQRTGAEVWVKHENHTPIGAFKLRGGLVYMTRLAEASPDISGVITATRGNHGQSVALAAAKTGRRATIVVPHGNNPEKNAAMRAFGADLVEHGADFQEAREYTQARAGAENLHMIAPFHPWLVQGVASYALEFMDAHQDLDTIYVPIGMGSGICGLISARDALGLAIKIVGVVAETAAAYALSFEAGRPVSTNTSDTIADGMACRTPDPDALAVILNGAERIVRVSDEDIIAAMAAYFTDTQNVAEGAGAAPLAGLMRERDQMQGKKVGLILCGGNADAPLFQRVLATTAS